MVVLNNSGKYYILDYTAQFKDNIFHKDNYSFNKPSTFEYRTMGAPTPSVSLNQDITTDDFFLYKYYDESISKYNSYSTLMNTYYAGSTYQISGTISVQLLNKENTVSNYFSKLKMFNGLLTKAFVQDNITEIPVNAFVESPILGEISLPKTFSFSLTTGNPFLGCYSLKNINIRDNDNKKYKVINDVILLEKENSSGKFILRDIAGGYLNSNSITTLDLNIDSSTPIKVIGKEALSKKQPLKYMEFVYPTSCEEISDRAFADSNFTKSIGNIPGTVKTIGNNIFDGCFVSDINLGLDGGEINTTVSNLESISASALSGCQDVERIMIPENKIELPEDGTLAPYIFLAGNNGTIFASEGDASIISIKNHSLLSIYPPEIFNNSSFNFLPLNIISRLYYETISENQSFIYSYTYPESVGVGASRYQRYLKNAEVTLKFPVESTIVFKNRSSDSSSVSFNTYYTRIPLFNKVRLKTAMYNTTGSLINTFKDRISLKDSGNVYIGVYIGGNKTVKFSCTIKTENNSIRYSQGLGNIVEVNTTDEGDDASQAWTTFEFNLTNSKSFPQLCRYNITNKLLTILNGTCRSRYGYESADAYTDGSNIFLGQNTGNLYKLDYSILSIELNIETSTGSSGSIYIPPISGGIINPGYGNPILPT